MKRFVDDQLLRWKHAARRKPLILRGGRQIGKTWSIEKFGQDQFKSVLKVDMEKRGDLHGIFRNDLRSKTVLSQLSVALHILFI